MFPFKIKTMKNIFLHRFVIYLTLYAAVAPALRVRMNENVNHGNDDLNGQNGENGQGSNNHQNIGQSGVPIFFSKNYG